MTILHLSVEDTLRLAGQLNVTAQDLDQYTKQLASACQAMEWQAVARAGFDDRLQDSLAGLSASGDAAQQLAQRVAAAVTNWEQVANSQPASGGSGSAMNAILDASGGGQGLAGLSVLSALNLAPLGAIISPGWLASLPDWLRKLLSPDTASEQPIVLPKIPDVPQDSEGGKSGFGKLLEKEATKQPEAAAPSQPGAPAAGIPAAPSTPPPTAGETPIYDVPLKSQGNLMGGYACSPTSASMVLEYYHNQDPNNKTASPEDLIGMLDPGDAGKTGMSLSDLTDELNDLGYHNIDVKLNASVADLKTELQAGPVITVVSSGNILHAVVVKGFNADGALVINDPLKSTEVILSEQSFKKIWSKGSNSYYAIHP